MGKGRLFSTFTARFAIRSREGDIYPCGRPGLPHDGLKRIAQLFHARKGTPITWFLDWTAARECGKLFREWHEEYGDEVALWLDEFGPKTWLSELRMEFKGQKSLHYSMDEQRRMIRFVKDTLEREAYGPIRTAASLWFNETTVTALADEGFTGLWGYCWHQENVDEATHRGCPWYPFYPSTRNYKIPAQEKGDNRLVGAHWFITDMTNSHFMCENHNIGFVRVTPHPGEEDRSGFARDGSNHTHKTLVEWERQRGWNDFVYTTFHLECDWVSGQWNYPNGVRHEDRVVDLFESYLHEMERLDGSEIVTIGEFTDWFRDRHEETPRQCFYFRDVIPDRRLWFKDRAYGDTVFYGSKTRKLVFSKDRGSLPIEVLDYEAQHSTSASQRYPGVASGPDGFINMGYLYSFGIWLDDEKAEWLAKLELTSALEFSEFGVMFWDVNLPLFVRHDSITASQNARELKFFGEEQAILAIFDLKVGRNEILLKAPVEGVEIAEGRDRSDQLDIRIQNRHKCPVNLARLKVRIGAGHQIKDVVFGSRTVPLGYCGYDRKQSKEFLTIDGFYPETFVLKPGMNVFEVVKV